MLEPNVTGPSQAARTPLVMAGAAFVVGTGLGLAMDARWVWLGAALLAIAVGGVCLRRQRASHAGRCAMVALAALAAAHAATRTYHPPKDDLRHDVGAQASLATVVARVEEVVLSMPQEGAFGRFSYQAPTTGVLLRVQAIDSGEGLRPCHGRLLGRIGEADPSLRAGALIEATGWLSRFDPPDNPGQRDTGARLAAEGVSGRLALASRGNWRELEPPSAAPPLQRLRRTLATRADAALAIGFDPSSRRLAFLRALLLGQYQGDLGPLSEAFRDTGLTHLLSISGAHLGILTLVIWSLARLVCRRPDRVALIVLVCLAMYILAIPASVPVLRAGVMAGLFCIAQATGRRISGLDVLALAAIALLWWRPADLVTPGFQLSFGIVAVLLIFTHPLAVRIWPHGRRHEDGSDALDAAIARGADYLAANTVAFCAAIPLVAYHFQIITPWAGLVSLLALPAVAVTLTLGYLKILLGALLPSVSLLLAAPLGWAAEAMMGLVGHAATWPGSSFTLPGPPSVLWTLAMLAAALALVGRPRGAGRHGAWVATGFCGLWLAMLCIELPLGRGAPPVTVYMLSVRDGSCFLLRISDPSRWFARPINILFDCGSQSDLDVARRKVIPALQHLGVRHLDAIVVSHADLDHFCGVLDVVDAVSTDCVLAPPPLLAEGEREPEASVGYLLSGLRQRGIPVTAIARGYEASWHHAEARILWPPRDFEADVANDTSLVLSLTHGSRRLLLTGDIQQRAITGLMALESDLAADVTDLPHHGSFVRASPEFLAAVSPQVVLQSCHQRRLEDDPWAPWFEGGGPERYVTARDGMVTVTLDDHAIITRTFVEHPPP